MKDARFTIPTPGLLAKVVDLLDVVPMEDRDTTGDLAATKRRSNLWNSANSESSRSLSGMPITSNLDLPYTKRSLSHGTHLGPRTREP